MPTKREQYLSLHFSFGELEVLSHMPQTRREEIIAASICRMNEILQRSHYHAHMYDSGSLAREVTTLRKRGEPDWQEVERDAVREVAHKMFAEQTI